MSKRYEVKLNDRTIRNVEIEYYDAAELAKDLNDPDKNMISIGAGASAIVVQRYSVISVIPADIADEEDGDE